MTELPAWQLPVEGARVRLRPLRMKDLPDFLSYRSDPKVGRFQGWSPMDADEAQTFILAMQAVERPRAGDWVQFAIALREDDTLVGDVGLHLDDAARTAQVGYTCMPNFQRNGFATEAVGLLLGELAFNTPCTSVIATTDSRNSPSERLLQRLGFAEAERVPLIFRGEACTEVIYTLRLDPMIQSIPER